MKKIFTLIILFMLSPNAFSADDVYYWYKGDKYALQLKTDKKFILLQNGIDKDTLSQKLRIEKDKIDDIKSVELGTSLIPYKINEPDKNNHNWTVITSGGNEIDVSSQIILYHAPFFYSKSGKELGLSHLFYVRLYKQDDISLLEELAQNNGVKIMGNNRFMPLWYTLSCNRGSRGNALEMANLFFETGFFKASQPDLMAGNLLQNVNDPFFVDQWNLNNTGQYDGISGSDIQATDAWKITKGHSGIILAILDQGLEMNHPDLQNMYSTSYNTETGTSPSQVYGDHGVAVAGIAGANTNNNEGVAGIAPACQLMSISNILDDVSINTQQQLADGINFAWENGAHIINNSWGHDDLDSDFIDEAIDDAVTYGRDELGTVVVCAAGNDEIDDIIYPSAIPDVIAVGAVSMCDELKSYSSCDTEWKWGSNYGTGLDVVAPGVLIPTTDRQGYSFGYNYSVYPLHTYWGGGNLITSDYNNTDYTVWFNGTSAAAPHVSGIAALVLSINSNLTLQQVRNAIEGSCEKIGNYTYTLGAGEQSGLTWNNEMGYGRVNAYKALKYTIENYGALLGVGMSQVTLPLWENMTLKSNVNLASNNTLTIQANNLVTISAYSGTVTIGGTGSLPKIASGESKDDNGSEAIPTTKEFIPDAFQLSQNYPNPFNPTTVINYSLPAAEKVVLKIYDVLGREIAELIDEFKEAGEYTVTFDASSLASGVYFYRIDAGKFSQTKRLVLVK